MNTLRRLFRRQPSNFLKRCASGNQDGLPQSDSLSASSVLSDTTTLSGFSDSSCSYHELLASCNGDRLTDDDIRRLEQEIRSLEEEFLQETIAEEARVRHSKYQLLCAFREDVFVEDANTGRLKARVSSATDVMRRTEKVTELQNKLHQLRSDIR